MEPNGMEPNNDPRNPVTPQALIPGVILVGLGALFLLGNLHIIHSVDWIAYWPVILIAIGLVQLVDAEHSHRRVGGVICLVLGGLFLGDNLGYLDFGQWIWPLILIGAGVMMLLNRTGWAPQFWQGGRYRVGGTFRAGGAGGYSSRPYGPNLVNEFAIFGGSKRVVTNPDFQGGHVSCIFGGVNLDLTAAGMVGNTAVLDISTLWGGVTVRIPASWNVEVRGIGIFGGFSDHTFHPPVTPETKRLIVRGGAVFGGVNIKNARN